MGSQQLNPSNTTHKMGNKSTRLFKDYDQDKDGFISEEDLKKFMMTKVNQKVKELESRLTKDVNSRIKVVVQKTDISKDGKISEEEFKNLIENKETQDLFDKLMNLD